jgi:hypothetical protein
MCTPDRKTLAMGTAVNGWAPAMTLGDTIVADGRLSPLELGHELGHVSEERAWGPFIIQSYLVAEIAGRVAEPTSSDCNLFEIDAGPGGHYGECHPWWT